MSSRTRLLKLIVLPLAAALAFGADQALAAGVVLSGQTNPAETAIDSSGNLYYTADSGSGSTTLYELPAGAATPTAVYSLTGTLPRVFDIAPLGGGDLAFLQATGDFQSGRHYSLVAFLHGGPVTITQSDATLSADLSTVTSGSVLSSLAVDAGGRIYFSTQDWDATNGNDSDSLYVIQQAAQNPGALHRYAHDPNAPAPQLLITVSGPGQNSNGILDPLAPDPAGGIFASLHSSTLTNGLYRIGLDGSLRLIATGGAPNGNVFAWRALGFDASGNLYAARRTFFGWQHFGCADSTTFSVIEYTPADLSSSSPVGADVGDLSESGFVAWWAGSSTFNRAAANGAAAIAVSPVTSNCPTGSGSPFTETDQVLRMPAGGGPLTVVTAEGPYVGNGPPLESPDEGPYSLAFDPAGNLFVASAVSGTVTEY